MVNDNVVCREYNSFDNSLMNLFILETNMGVRGLFSFAENKFDCFESTSLKDTKLIIDGNNLRFFLYKRTKKRKCSFGGEYLLYFNATRDYFNRYTCKLC